MVRQSFMYSAGKLFSNSVGMLYIVIFHTQTIQIMCAVISACTIVNQLYK